MNKYRIEITGHGSEIAIGTVDYTDREMILDLIAEGGLISEILFNGPAYGLSDWFDYDDVYYNHSPIIDEKFNMKIYENDEIIHEMNNEDIYEEHYDNLAFNFMDIKEKNIIVGINNDSNFLYESYFEAEKFELSKLKIFIDEDIEVDDVFYTGNLICNIRYDDEMLHDDGEETNNTFFNAYCNF